MTLHTLSISNVVNVQVNMSPLAAATRNFGAALIIGTSPVIDVSERIRTYSSSELTDIATAFGSTSPEYLAAVAFFGQSPKPSAVQIGRWIQSPSSGLLKGAILTTAQQQMSNFTSIESGAFDVTVDGEVLNVQNINLSEQVNLNGVASQVSGAMKSRALCEWNGSQFVITSATTGKTSTVTNASDTDLTRALGLASGTTAVGGAPAETLPEAISALIDYPSWYMAVLAAPAESDAIVSAAQIIEAANPRRLFSITTQDTTCLSPQDTSSVGYLLSKAGLQRTLWVYSSSSPYAAASVLGRMSTINFEGGDTTITLKFKQLPGIAPENLTLSQANAISAKNGNVFVAYDNDTAIIQEGVMAGGWYIDERQGLDWLENYVATAVWNLLYDAGKVGQDEVGST